MDICIGNSRKDKFWKNEEISLEKFIKDIKNEEKIKDFVSDER